MTDTSPVLRLIVDPPTDGRYNMALDRAIQLCVENGESPPTLRLYRWFGPTVTLGRFQDVESFDSAFAAVEGISVARRFTGGRGVLHDDELTYAFIASLRHGIPKGISASYAYISQALMSTFSSLGVDARISEGNQATSDSGACYLTSTKADLCVGAAKLSGSAQVWLGETVLQHGCFVRTRDVEREARLFRLDDSQRDRLARTSLTLADLLPEPPALEQLTQAVCGAFEALTGRPVTSGEYSPEELRIASELRLHASTDGSMNPRPRR